ncbi:hypothetical protein DUI87_25316 [Hirundo rustica rustica]|uniref:Teneurin N-terminal domain-containing protein n=1 Tax=Hirundo rustica rustica TaxID=333673 RepID=A0A3M0JDK2_HIRRU|nr:hypothetical protein DUI87_25316 [Hirundo rustica rustica]
MEQMDCKPYQPLSKVKHEVDLTYTSSSDESEDGGKQRQSYDSRETLNEYSQELRLNYNSQGRKRKAIDQSTQDREENMGPRLVMADICLEGQPWKKNACIPAPEELASAQVVLQELEFCETPRMLCSGYQAELQGVAEHGYPLEVGSDGDTETEGAASPEHALRMWMRGIKSEHSSCLSSRANSALSLTDTDHERKSDGENERGFAEHLPWKILIWGCGVSLSIVCTSCRMLDMEIEVRPGKIQAGQTPFDAGKIREQVLETELGHVEDTGVVGDSQHRFTKGTSCLTGLVTFGC